MVNRWKMSKVDAKFERNGIENHRAQMREMKKKMATTRYAKSRPTRSNAVKRQQWWLALAADWPAVVEGVGQTRPLRTRPSPPGPSADGSRMPRLGRHRTPSIRCWPPLHQVLLLLLLLRRRFHSSHATHRDHFFFNHSRWFDVLLRFHLLLNASSSFAVQCVVDVALRPPVQQGKRLPSSNRLFPWPNENKCLISNFTSWHTIAIFFLYALIDNCKVFSWGLVSSRFSSSLPSIF